MTREQELQEAFLRDREAKRIKEEGTIASPLSDVINKRKKGKGITTHRTIYERKYLKENIGKQCYYCKDTLTEENILIKSIGAHSGHHKDKFYCVRCAMLSSHNRKIVSEKGYDAYLRLKDITETIDMLKHRIKHNAYMINTFVDKNSQLWKEIEEARTTIRYRKNVTALELPYNPYWSAKDKNYIYLAIMLEGSIKELDRLTKEMISIKTSNKVKEKKIAKDKVIPFRSEEDFDF